MTLEHTADGDRNGARFLRNDNNNGIRGFAHADSRTVARAQIAAQILISGQGQHTRGRADTPLTHNGRAVMQRRFWIKNILEQLGRRRCVDRRTSIHNFAELFLPLKHHENARAGPAHRLTGDYSLIDCLLDRIFIDLAARDETLQIALAQLLQNAAQFGLKDNKQCDGTISETIR